jgi:methyl-accepting chemotaxis protein
VSDNARNIARLINLIARSNREHSSDSMTILKELSDIRQIAERNVKGVRDTQRSTESLVERARTLDSIMDGFNGNGRAGKKARSKKKAKK